MSPVPKKSRLPKSDDAPAANNDSNSGIIRFEVDKVSTLDREDRFTPIVEVGGVPWKGQACKQHRDHDGKDILVLSLNSIDNESSHWSIEVQSEITLLNSDSNKSISVTNDSDTYDKDYNLSNPLVLEWKELLDEGKGFIKDDKIKIEIRFSILKMKGIWIQPRFNSSAGENSSKLIMMKEGTPTLMDENSLFPHDMDTTGNSNDSPNSGFIRFEVENVSSLDLNERFSHEVKVAGLTWSLCVKKASFLEVYLFHHHKSESHIWSFDVSAILRLINSIPDGKSKTSSFLWKFNHEDSNRGYNDFILWDDLIDEEKGFLKDDKITIEAKFKLSNIVGIRTISPVDFTNPRDPRHDVTLMIKGEKVFVGKQILAFHSPFFNAMFYGNHVEKNKKEIELKEIDRNLFIEILNLIYPSYQKINDNNAESLLKMADYFQINIVIDQVEQFLMNSTKWTAPAKLKLSDQYRLVKLQDRCLDSFKSVMDVMNLQESDVYKSLSDKVKATLLDKSMKLSKGN